MGWGFLDYVPFYSNVKGAVEGNFNQALFGPLGKLAGDAAGKPYEKAAQGARDVAQDANRFSGEQWGRQMEGLDKAWGAYGGADSYVNNWMRAQGPGAMQQWWNENDARFSQPTASSGLWDRYQQQYMNQPSQTRGSFGQAYNMIGGESGQQQFLRDYGGVLSGQRSQGEQAYSRNQRFYDDPSKSEDMYGHLDATYKQMQSSAEKRNQDQLAELKAAGRSEMFRPETVSKMDAFQQALPGMQGRAQMESSAPELQGYYRGAGDVSDFYNSQRGALQGPGTFEQFVQADIGGYNPAMARAKDQGIARINQEQARRGGFRSGAADVAIGNFLGEMEAREYDQRAQRAQQAQQMQLGRIGQGGQLAQASSQGRLAQGSALQGLAGARDTEKRARIDQYMNATQAASNEGMANQRMQLDANVAADNARLARLKAGADVGAQGYSQQLAALQGLQGAGAQSDQALLSRLAGSQAGAGASDAAMMNRFNTLGDWTRGVDANNLARASGIYGMGQGVDQIDMARWGQAGQLAGNRDQAHLAQLLGGGNMAGQAQGYGDKRMNDVFQALYGLGQGRAGTVQGFYGQGGQLSGQSMQDAWNALLNSYGLEAQGGAARAQLPFQVAGVGIQGAKAYYGGGMG